MANTWVNTVTFSGKLRLLNRLGTAEAIGQQLADAEFANSVKGQLNAQNLNELADWLSNVSETSDVHAVASNLLSFVKTIADVLQSPLAQQAKGRVAKFLAEALRVYNLARHDADVINEFIRVIRRCGIEIVGNPDKCVESRNFSTLGVIEGDKIQMLCSA
jgi:hypothetical protein